MAFFGYIHFFSSAIGAIHSRKLSDLNPAYLINIDRFLGSFYQNDLVFTMGWLIFFGLVGGFYLLFRRND